MTFANEDDGDDDDGIYNLLALLDSIGFCSK